MAFRALFNDLILPVSADFHVHLRDGDMMNAVVPTIRQGGVDTVFVMPNLVPPITTVKQALDYRTRLQDLAPDVTFLMSLYLHPSITPETVHEAKAAGIAGIKSYPAGVTTNSASGVIDYEHFYPVFQAMEEVDLVLNLHGEVPSSNDITILNAEEAFLPTLLDLHRRFPKLRIVLEHCTTAAAIKAVQSCGPNVVGTITAHHLWMTIDDWANDPFNYCKPVAKLPSDRLELLRSALLRDKFFLGTDSAPHPLKAKRGGETGLDKCAAGVFTQPYATQLVLEAFERALGKGLVDRADLSEANIRAFLGGRGRTFYEQSASLKMIRVRRKNERIVNALNVQDGNVVVPFRRNELIYSLEWI